MIRHARVMFAAMLVTGLLSGLTVTGVWAGGSGQEVSMHDVNGNVYSAVLKGYNQSCLWKTFGITNWPNPYYDTTGFWWQKWDGSIGNNRCYASSGPKVDAYPQANYQGGIFATFYFGSGPPHSQSSNWWTCQIDGGTACASGYRSV